MRTLAILFVLALALVFTSAATADPSGPNVQDNLTFTCDGQQVVMNGGTLTNRSHQVFVVGAPYIFVAQSAVVLTPDGETIVFFDTAPGIQGAITCVATANGFTLTVSGFFTPATWGQAGRVAAPGGRPLRPFTTGAASSPKGSSPEHRAPGETLLGSEGRAPAMRLTPELEPERELAWVQTAEKADLSMDAWAIRALDEAAHRVAAPQPS